MKKTASFLDDFLKITATSTFLLIVVGFVELKTYYSKFGIAINDYISTSEILLSSIDRLSLVIFSLLIQMIFWYSLFNYLFDYDLSESVKDGERRPLKYHDETIHRFVKNKTVRFFWIILVSGTIITVIFSTLNSQSNFWTSLKDFFLINYWIGMCIYLAWLQPTRKIWESLKNNKEYNGKVILTLLIFFTVCISTLWVKNSFQFNRIRKYGNNKSVQIILNDKSKVAQTDTIRFVGQTEKYFFYWNKISRVTTVYPSSEVSNIIVR